MALDRRLLFDGWRATFGPLDQGQVEGINALVAEMERREWLDQRWYAYVLATAWHETARTMQPIEEFGKGRGKPYGQPDPITGKAYYGRGHVQLTWKENYQKLGERLGRPLVRQPELALSMPVSVDVCCEGMAHGLFTGKELADYFDEDTDDPKNARRIVNGLDRAELIAGHHREILAVIGQAWITEEPAPVPTADLEARIAAAEVRIAEIEKRLAAAAGAMAGVEL